MDERIGFAVHKLPPNPWASPEERLELNRQMLARVLNLHTLVAFVGAGCSVPLGYPTWQQMALNILSNAAKEFQRYPDNKSASEVGRLRRFQAQLSNASVIDTDQILFMLGVCQKMVQRRGSNAEVAHRAYVASLFNPPEHLTSSPNPYEALIRMHIDRFVTSNYDCELERALVSVKRIPQEEFLFGAVESRVTSRRRSFTQQPEYYEHLALFVLSRIEEAQNMVFHCHGHYKDPASMVVTEADYQRWYLRNESGSLAFRQTLDLLFGSNPILFVGFGMTDRDLLRPLRMFSAADAESKSPRPLFALLEEEEPSSGDERDRNENYYEFLHQRYGVQVIPYKRPRDAGPSERGQALCSALLDLEDYRLSCRHAWLRKPAVRRVEVAIQPPNRYQHYPFLPIQAPELKGSRVRRHLDELHQAAVTGAKLIALVGLGGTGKSWYAERLIDRLENESASFDGYFFWSSYYSNDALTGMDRVLAYLDRNHDVIESNRIERFRKCLSRGRYLLVFDGIERFLVPGENPDEGRVFSPAAGTFLEAMADRDSTSLVLLTSRLWPEVFNPLLATDPKVLRKPILRLRTDDLIEVEPFTWADHSKQVSALCSLLDGHVYAIVLAAELLRKAGRIAFPETFAMISSVLAGTPPDRRISRMIRLSIENLDIRSHGLAEKLLERLSVFMSPIRESTLSICYEEAVKELESASGESLEELVTDLVANRLVHVMTTKRGQTAPPAYTVHPVVREYVYQRAHRASNYNLPNFTLPGFTAATASLDPGTLESGKMLKSLFVRLQQSAEVARKGGNYSEARALCRSAFSLVRSRMELITTPRWCSYDDYLRLMVELSHLAKRVSPVLWDYTDPGNVTEVEHPHGPLYADDLAWLYNEMGLACYGEGAILDALAIWEQGLEINRVIESYEEGGQYLFQSQCNLGASYIHAGQLNIAERYLKDAERTNYRLGDTDHRARITGYLGLVQHLRGSLTKADHLYRSAVNALETEVKNPRAESIFLKHWADLKMRLSEDVEARRMIDSSRALAEAAQFPELVAGARLSFGHWLRKMGKYGAAYREYDTALGEAERIGMKRLECDVISELSQLALDLGDHQTALQRAIEALGIANNLGLGLRKTHGLVVLGRASLKGGQTKLGIAYLKHAQRLANQQGYWLRGHEAEELLSDLGDSA